MHTCITHTVLMWWQVCVVTESSVLPFTACKWACCILSLVLRFWYVFSYIFPDMILIYLGGNLALIHIHKFMGWHSFYFQSRLISLCSLWWQLDGGVYTSTNIQNHSVSVLALKWVKCWLYMKFLRVRHIMKAHQLTHYKATGSRSFSEINAKHTHPLILGMWCLQLCNNASWKSSLDTVIWILNF